MQKFSIALALVFAAVLGPLTTGCSMLKKKPPTAKAFYWDLVFRRGTSDPEFQRVVFDLDVIGADEQLKLEIEKTDPSLYFAPQGELRKRALSSGTTLVFRGGDKEQKLAKEHALYKSWNDGASAKPNYLVFIANLPSSGSGSAKDARIRSIPYDSKQFPREIRSKKLMTIEIVPGQIKDPMRK
ncbi:MAG: hypothetical protein IT581_10850 [Verrucomicrobiales bacterium]|nr:hypothetical protein [Verrucomicrobiales bacterium]